MYENIDKMQYTPMMRQYLEIKEKYPDMLVFFRLGDFYEMFFNDAIVASKELEIVLTARDAGAKDRVPMCGVPYHSVSSYLDKLTEKGYKIAIVEQTSNPEESKGIVTREVTRIITPGTVTEGSNLHEKDNNFIVSISKEKDRYIVSYSDLSTGENFLTSLPLNDELVNAEILKLNAKEIVIASDFNANIFNDISKIMQITISIENNTEKVKYLSSLTEDLDPQEEKNFLRLLNYILNTQKRSLVHMQKVIKYDADSFLKIDLSSRRNLELLETLRFGNKKNSLLSVIDKCETAMGSRFLKKNLIFPLVDKEKILKRYDIIDSFKKHFLEAAQIRKCLESVYDLERIVGRISYENANPRDLLQLKRSLKIVPEIKKLITKIKVDYYFDLNTNYDEYIQLYELLEKAILEDAPYTIKEGNIIKPGYSDELDELRNINENSKDYLIALEAKERQRTGIKNLRVGYNRVFGYYLEVSKGNSNLVKEEFGYIRKQTLANSERFITQELKEKEVSILRAEEKALELEYDLFIKLRDEIKKYTNSLQFLGKTLSEMDMLLCFQRVANENNYVRPNINDNNIIELKSSRHPVIEKYTEVFIPNDLYMDEKDAILLITGPNMSGKSTYMRQVALNVILAQMGSFVPAKVANLPIFDAIYTRIGAADDIVSGQSTFMVEMTEVNNALKNASKNSLIIFDEIGRGTATYDGLALAQAIIEYISQNIKCKTLFSTHYHELTDLENELDNLKNVHVSADEVNGDIVFMHKVLKGAADKSYGINVAKLANIPLEVTLRANDILLKLEASHNIDNKVLSIKNYQQPLIYDSKSEKEQIALDKIKNTEIYKLNPLDALNLLDEIQKLLKK
jgi:DNA mismatch repair protein MutS